MLFFFKFQQKVLFQRWQNFGSCCVCQAYKRPSESKHATSKLISQMFISCSHSVEAIISASTLRQIKILFPFSLNHQLLFSIEAPSRQWYNKKDMLTTRKQKKERNTKATTLEMVSIKARRDVRFRFYLPFSQCLLRVNTFLHRFANQYLSLPQVKVKQHYFPI